MHQVYLSLGSNVGNRKTNLNKALKLIGETGEIAQVSDFYETEAWGNSDQPAFFNLAVKLLTGFDPEELLESMKKIEKKCGRMMTPERYMPRTLDIDILFYDNLIMSTDKLIIPHPLIHERRFVLIPMAQIAADYVHPVLGRTVSELLARCGDELNVQKVR